MTEPIEKWKQEAREYIESIPSSMDYWNVFDIERAYIAGKMSQPVVELPKPEKDDHTDVAFYVNKFFEALADAGIQCRTKGD